MKTVNAYNFSPQALANQLDVAVEIIDDIVMEIGIISDFPTGHMEQNIERAKKFLEEHAATTQAHETGAK